MAFVASTEAWIELESQRMESGAFKDSLTDAIRFWEPRRLIYNAVLSAIVIVYFLSGFPASKAQLSVDFVLSLFLLAVIANIAYCAAYLADIFVQLSGFREVWQRSRWVLFAVGTTFAAVITRFVVIGFFQSH